MDYSIHNDSDKIFDENVQISIFNATNNIAVNNQFKKQSAIAFLVLNIVYVIGVIGNISALIILLHKDKVSFFL